MCWCVCVCYMVKAPLSPQKGPTNCGVAEDFDPEAELVCERRRRMQRKGEAKLYIQIYIHIYIYTFITYTCTHTFTCI